MALKADELHMREALKEAESAFSAHDEPVGAIIVSQRAIVARAHHQVKLLRDPTAHATIIAITQAANAAPSGEISGASVYVTREPCTMCVGALLLSGASRLVIGALDAKRGACGSIIDLTANERLNKKLTIVRGVLSSDCQALLRKSATTASK